MDRIFDRVARWDPRNEAYLVSDLLGIYISAEDRVLSAEIDALTARVIALESAVKPTPAPAPTPSKVIDYATSVVLDQGQTGMCVGYGWTDLAQCAPKPEKIVAGAGGDDESSTADAIYDLARKIDGDANPEDPQGGASTQGGAAASKQLGFVSSYHWATNASDVVAALSVGPLVIGVDWYSGMMDVDASDQIHATGTVQGGHEILVRGYDPSSKLFKLQNSWGASWGASGCCFLSSADLSKLLAAGGDAALPLK